ncbi:MAG: hypothetical protein KF778_14845 [Rhodocyclaceae bacterium]|nr:hypothetical protein [Rhodocyclaceae bacterium]
MPALWMLLLLLALPVAASPIQVLDHADFVLDEGAVPPPDSAPWQRQSLPDHWRQSRPGASGNGWYRFRFRADQPNQSVQAVYLPQLALNAAVWLNAAAIGDGGRFDEPVARNWNRPLLFLIPPGLVRPGDNTLYVRLRNHAYTQAALHPLALGPEDLLQAQYEQAFFWHITLNQTATLLIAAVGVLTLSLWLRRRRDTAYAYFGISALLWALQSVNLYVRSVPVATAYWEIFANATFQVFSGFLLISLLRFIGIKQARLAAALWFGILAAPVSLALVPAGMYMSLTSLWHFYTLLAAACTLALLLRAAVRGRDRDARFLVGAMGMVLLFGLHDWLMHSRYMLSGTPALPLDNVFLLHYAAPLVFLAVGLIMTGRYVQVLNEFESLNGELETRVRIKHAELQDSYARMRELEMERAVAEERERIYRDLHDDVGAKLLSLVYRAGRPEDADLARSALRDLREVVSLTGGDRYELENLMADWRIECEQRLREAGVTLNWRQTGAPDAISLSQQQALHLGRILREAISNVIRHAGAAGVQVCFDAGPDTLNLEIADDGCGLVPGAQNSAGRGLRNMQSRATRLGARLETGPGAAGGCRIALRLPI